MNPSEILRIVDAIHRDKNIDKEIVFEGVEAAWVSALKKSYGEEAEIVVRVKARFSGLRLSGSRGGGRLGEGRLRGRQRGRPRSGGREVAAGPPCVRDAWARGPTPAHS